jgi:large subunit ribosomal protein L25
LTLTVDGKDELTIAKAIQRDPIKGVYEHIDLLAVRSGEKITVELPLVVVGDVAPGGLLAQEHSSVSVEAEATHLPTELEVSVEGLGIGSQITAGDLVLPEGTTLVTDPEALVLHVGASPTAEDLEGEVAEAAEALGIVADQPQAATEPASGSDASE